MNREQGAQLILSDATDAPKENADVPGRTVGEGASPLLEEIRGKCHLIQARWVQTIVQEEIKDLRER